MLRYRLKENDEVELPKKNILSFTCLEKLYMNSEFCLDVKLSTEYF